MNPRSEQYSKMSLGPIDCNKPLPSHTRLDYWECYAKVILETLYPDEFQSLLIVDKPDLRTLKNLIGIEVTSAVPQSRREALALWNEIPYIDQKEGTKSRDRMTRLGVTYQGGVQSWPVQNYSSDNIKATPINTILKVFAEKEKRLNSGSYAGCQRYDLFIHSESWLVDDNIGSLNSGITKYRYVFLTTTEDFFRFDLLQKSCSTVYYGDFSKIQYNMACEARKLVEEGEDR